MVFLIGSKAVGGKVLGLHDGFKRFFSGLTSSAMDD